MVVQHNITAMNSNRQLGITTGIQAKSSEKLSSGYKINRAADDAAGLAISEKMRRQVRGLTQASSNAQDGISVVQTAGMTAGKNGNDIADETVLKMECFGAFVYENAHGLMSPFGKQWWESARFALVIILYYLGAFK